MGYHGNQGTRTSHYHLIRTLGRPISHMAPYREVYEVLKMLILILRLGNSESFKLFQHYKYNKFIEVLMMSIDESTLPPMLKI